jgi:hypothetical protein
VAHASQQFGKIHGNQAIVLDNDDAQALAHGRCRAKAGENLGGTGIAGSQGDAALVPWSGQQGTSIDRLTGLFGIVIGHGGFCSRP